VENEELSGYEEAVMIHERFWSSVPGLGNSSAQSDIEFFAQFL
jgi:hypothetical protein